MKSLLLLLGVIFSAILIAGCVQKPKEYHPRDAAEAAVLAYCKQTVPKLVVVKIDTQATDPNKQAMLESMAKSHGSMKVYQAYHVTFASPDDASMITTWVVPYNLTAQQVIENKIPPAPCVKADR